MDPRRFVFVDECSTNVRMVPLRARAPKGERAFGKAPRNWKENVTLVSSISLAGGMGASMSVEGSADGEAFLLYVEHLSGEYHAPIREYFGLHVRGSPEPDGPSSERGTTVSSAILLHWSRVPDPPDEFRS